MAFTMIPTTMGQTAYGVATASGSVHSIVATTRDARKLVLTTLGVKTAVSNDTTLVQVPILGRVIDVLSVSQSSTQSGNPVFVSGYTQNPLALVSGVIAPPLLVASVQADQGALSGANWISVQSLNGAMATQSPYSGYFVFKILTVGV